MQSPSQEELVPVIEALRKENSTLGVVKFQSLLLSNNPQWTVSEKRVKKILTELGMGPASSNDNDKRQIRHIYPTSKLNKTLKLEQWTCESSSCIKVD